MGLSLYQRKILRKWEKYRTKFYPEEEVLNFLIMTQTLTPADDLL